MHYVYILLSKKDGKLYIGSAKDLKKRLSQHKKGLARATKNRRPLELIHYEAYFHKSDAKKREEFFKGGKGHEELKIQLKSAFKKLRYRYRF